MEKLIVIEGKEKYQYKDLKSLIEVFICKNYFEMSDSEKKDELEKRTIANTIFNNIKVEEISNDKKTYDENSFILYDEITYILSLLKFDKIILLERIDAEIFGKYINRENMEDNYIIVNKFASEIMKKYLKQKLEK